MLVVITTISSLVHVYSISYIKDDPFLARFISYLSLFTFLMLSLVLADNYLQLFFGWEGVGLASFLLISFWSSRLQACKAATKAIIINNRKDPKKPEDSDNSLDNLLKSVAGIFFSIYYLLA